LTCVWIKLEIEISVVHYLQSLWCFGNLIQRIHWRDEQKAMNEKIIMQNIIQSTGNSLFSQMKLNEPIFHLPFVPWTDFNYSCCITKSPTKMASA